MKSSTHVARSGRRSAFTLIELLMVIVIIALLAAMGIPAITGLTNSNRSAGASRQLANDLKLARSKAIAERTTVYVVFVPTNFTGLALSAPVDATSVPPRPTQADLALLARNEKLVEKLLNQKYTSYALFAERRVGDQPGRSSFKYLTPWRSLPEGSFIAAREFTRLPNATAWKNLPIDERPLPYGQFPFPSDTGDAPWFPMPYLAFNHLGQMIVPYYLTPAGDRQPVPGLPEDEIIHLAQGGIFYARDGSTGRLLNETLPGVTFEAAELNEVPPENSNTLWVRVNWLTGRAQIDQPQIVN
jgi:prepilin-type N-terminal cleavage/methylation domain-containing protein